MGGIFRACVCWAGTALLLSAFAVFWFVFGVLLLPAWLMLLAIGVAIRVVPLREVLERLRDIVTLRLYF